LWYTFGLFFLHHHDWMIFRDDDGSKEDIDDEKGSTGKLYLKVIPKPQETSLCVIINVILTCGVAGGY